MKGRTRYKLLQLRQLISDNHAYFAIFGLVVATGLTVIMIIKDWIR